MNSSNSVYSIDQILKLISSEGENLPKNQKKIADFVSANLKEAAFMSVTEMEQIMGVSKATIVRFTQSLGFDGYLNFKGALQQALQQQYANVEHYKLLNDLKESSLHRVARQDVANINKTIEHLSPTGFDKVVSLLSGAETIYTFGLGISALMGQIMAYSLGQVAKRSFSMLSLQLSAEEQLAFMSPKDVLVCFSFPPYSVETISLAKLAKKQGVNVVGITDSPASPIVEQCDEFLTVRSENLLFTNSIAAISMVINALITEIARRDESNTLKFMYKINEMMKDNGHFYD
ncbi:MAG: MurR/RpiR family transcriptional regulator [Balneolales bacterium]|nr:MurR/RpiR family transcriptional regulator [Balneolales bacterium]